MIFKHPGPIHTGRGTRCARKLERFSFDVACMQCGHPHSHQQVPFACVALCIASHVLCGLGPRLWTTDRGLKIKVQVITGGSSMAFLGLEKPWVASVGKLVLTYLHSRSYHAMLLHLSLKTAPPLLTLLKHRRPRGLDADTAPFSFGSTTAADLETLRCRHPLDQLLVDLTLIDHTLHSASPCLCHVINQDSVLCVSS